MITDLESFLQKGAPSGAERKLIDCWREGRICILNGGSLPESAEARKEARIRGPLLAFLLKSPDLKPGFGLRGGWVHDSLQLAYCRIEQPVLMSFCSFSRPPDLTGATLRRLGMSGCRLPGLKGEDLEVADAVLFKETRFTAQCDLRSARIGGQLSLSMARLECRDGVSLRLQRASIGHSLFLNSIDIQGTLDLKGVNIGGQCVLTGSSISCGNSEVALQAQEARLGSSLHWRGLKSVKGRISLQSAQVQTLVDDSDSWGLCQDGIDLESFSYGNIPSDCMGDLQDRLNWLIAGCSRRGFSPQPFTRLAAVLRDNGDDAAARLVLMHRERLYIAHEISRMRSRIRMKWDGPKGSERRSWRRALGDRVSALGLMSSYAVHRIWSCLKRLVIGYGYDPKRPLYWSLALILVGSVLASLGWQQGVITPASDQILTSGDWLAAMALDPVSPTRHWISSASAQHYEEFSPFLFALDTYLPVMDLGQEKAWAVTTVTTPGTIGRALWVGLQAAGWIVTSLGIAAVAGLVQKGRND